MIIAKLDKRVDGSVHLAMSGHARAAPRGEDLVCAGATTLAYTAAQVAQALYEEGKLVRKPKTDICEGKAVVIATPSEDAKQDLEQAFSVVGLGLEMLSHNYPDCIRLERRM